MQADLADTIAKAPSWPSDSPRRGMLSRFLDGTSGDYAELNDTTLRLWDWTVELAHADAATRMRLETLGIGSASVRSLLLADGDFIQRMREALEILHDFERRLVTPAGVPYRSAATGDRRQNDTSSPRPGSNRNVDDAAAATEQYEAVMGEYGPALRRVVWGFTRADTDAEDLYQTVALAVWRALPRFRGECSIRTYLFRIAHNCGITYCTKRRLETTPYDEMPDHGPSAGAVLDARRAREELVSAVRALPVGQRETMTLHLEGLSYREIGDVLGITEKTVSARLTRARQRLQQMLGGREQ